MEKSNEISMSTNSESMLVSYLDELGAGQFNHINGSMKKHLQGTYEILLSWDVEFHTAIAGLFHAIYGPHGLSGGLVSLEMREKVQSRIGRSTEMLVYLYCACDKTFVLPQFACNREIVFKDRFTGDKYLFPADYIQGFCEITVANDIDVARQKDVEVYDGGIVDMFKRMQGLLCVKGNTEISRIIRVHG